MSPDDVTPLIELIGKIAAIVGPACGAGWYGVTRVKRHAWDPSMAFLTRASATFEKVDKIDQRLRHQDARLAALMGAQPEAMFETCDQGEIVNINRAFETMTGFSRDAMAGMGWVNAIHPSDRGRIIRQWTEAVNDQRALIEDCRLRTSDGQVVRVRIEAYPMFDTTDRSVIGWHGRLEREERQ